MKTFALFGSLINSLFFSVWQSVLFFLYLLVLFFSNPFLFYFLFILYLMRLEFIFGPKIKSHFNRTFCGAKMTQKIVETGTGSRHKARIRLIRAPALLKVITIATLLLRTMGRELGGTRMALEGLMKPPTLQLLLITTTFTMSIIVPWKKSRSAFQIERVLPRLGGGLDVEWRRRR